MEYGNARLVHESLQAREHLLRDRPHLVKPLPFIFPVYANNFRTRATIRSSLMLYDLLTPRKVSPWHRSFNRREIQQIEPAIAAKGLVSSYLSHDAQIEMPERLCTEYLIEARELVADILNYTAVDFIVVRDGKAQGVDYHDVTTGDRFRANSRMIVNAAGPWIDAILAATGQPMEAQLGFRKGSHLVLQLDGRGPRHAIVTRAESNNRPIFIIPWLDHHLIGTTDTSYTGELISVSCEDWVAEYLSEEASQLLPGIVIEIKNVLYSYSGVRPLPIDKTGFTRLSKSRRGTVIDHKTEGVERLVSIVGGRLITAYRLGKFVGNIVQNSIGTPPRGGRPQSIPRSHPTPIPFLDPITVEHLHNRYGQRAADVAAYTALDPDLAAPISHLHPDIGAEVTYAVEHESAKTIGDVLLRRTAIGLTHDLGRSAAPNVAMILQKHFGWSHAERDQAVRDYEMELHRTFTVFDHAKRRAFTSKTNTQSGAVDKKSTVED